MIEMSFWQYLILGLRCRAILIKKSFKDLQTRLMI